MPHLHRRLGLAALFVLLLGALPLARPALALSFSVTTTADEDNGGSNACAAGAGCSLREAIRLANENAGADSISFGVTGEIRPATALPALSGGGTSINADSTNHQVVINGVVLAASDTPFGHGLRITSSGNEVRGLVIINFPGSSDFANTGSGIFIDGGDNNQLYNNWLGVAQNGSNAAANQAFGVLIGNDADGNIVGGVASGQPNVVSGNLRGNIAVLNAGVVELNEDNQIVGNYVGTNVAGTAAITGANNGQVQAGISIETGARRTIIDRNLVGGMTTTSGNPLLAGIAVLGIDTSPNNPSAPTGTRIIGNLVGVNAAGTAIPNRVGVRLGSSAAYGPYDTVLGDPANPTSATARNVIAGNAQRGIEIRDTGFAFGTITIAGSYIGLAPNGTPLGNGVLGQSNSEGVYVGSVGVSADAGRVTIGPGNVISANGTFGVRVRSGGHTIKGNFIGTTNDGQGSSVKTNPRYGNGAASVWLENGDGTTVGGAGAADRNVIAWSDSTAGGTGVGVLINPDASGGSSSCSGACSTNGNTVEGNYIGVRASGDGALNPTDYGSGQVIDREGIILRRTSNNALRGNVIAGVGIGITIGSTAANAASNNQIIDNKIGTRASGDLVNGIGNQQHGLRLLAGSGNQIENNLIAFNGAATLTTFYHGVFVSTANASNNTLLRNRVISNGRAGVGGYGVYVENDAVGIRISQTTTSGNANDGIGLFGGNGDRAAPTGLAITPGTPPVLTGSTGCSGCTVEVFTTNLSTENGEGPTYLTSGNADGAGNFSIGVAGCQQYLSATVTDGSGNTSQFSAALNTGNPGPCAQPLTLTLSAASPAARGVNPGGTAVYNHTLTHNVQAARTYTIVINSSQGWASAPTQVTVPAAPAGGTASASFDVTVTVPAGAAGGTVDTTTVKAVESGSGGASSNTQTDTTTVQSQNPATPGVSPGQTKNLEGATTTFVHTVTNLGDLPGDFSVVGLAFVGTPPAGWSIASATITPSTIPGQGTATLTIVVNTPGTPPPGSYKLRFQVAVAGGATTDPVEDTIVVAAVRSFTFTPEADQTKTTPPGADVVFEYTLTNTGNAADNFQVVAAVPGGSPITIQGVAATPSLNNLPANTASTVRVTFRVPPGTPTGNYPVSVTAQATGGTGAPPAITRNAVIQVTGGGSATITPGAANPDPVDVRAAPGTVTFVNTVENTGNAAVPIVVSPTIGGLPAGWSATVTDNSCDDTATLAPGATCTFTVSVTVPQGADGGTVDLTVSATADNSGQPGPPPNVTATAINRVNVLVVRGVTVEPDGDQTGGPTQVLTFTHTLTNSGNASDSYDLTVVAAQPGWSPLITPTVALDVPRGGTQQVTLTVRVPLGVLGGASNTFTVQAVSRGDASVSDTATDIARVAVITAADLSPGRRQNLDAGETITFTHQLTNTGTTLSAFRVEAANSQTGWTATVQGSPTAVLNPGERASLSVAVTAPADATPGISNTTTLSVFAVDAPDPAPLLDDEADISVVGPAFGALIEPDNSGQGRPNSTVVFTHTLTNIGTEQDTFELTVAEANGWPATVAPDVISLGPGQQALVTVQVLIPDGKRAGDPGFARVTAHSLTDPEVSDSAENEITVARVAGLELSSSQVRAVAPGNAVSLSSLALFNRGSATDVFDLTVSGADGGWSVQLSPSTAAVDKDSVFRVAVRVTVPSGVAPGTIKNIQVEARSRFDPTVRDSIQLTLVYPSVAQQPPPPTPTPPTRNNRLYLPFLPNRPQ